MGLLIRQYKQHNYYNYSTEIRVKVRTLHHKVSRAQIIVNRLIFKLPCSYQEKKSSMRDEKGRGRGNKAVWPFYVLSLNPSKQKKTPKTGNWCNPYKQPTADSCTVTVRRGGNSEDSQCKDFPKEEILQP